MSENKLVTILVLSYSSHMPNYLYFGDQSISKNKVQGGQDVCFYQNQCNRLVAWEEDVVAIPAHDILRNAGVVPEVL